MYYPVLDKNDVVEFLQQVDGPELTKMIFQKDYVSGLGRRSFNRFFYPCIEGANHIFFDSESF